MATYSFEKEQKISANMKEIWDFISSPLNLSRITPEYMGFDILTENLPEKIYPGMIITYHVRPLAGIRMKWVTEITHVREGEYFVDEQRQGPYSMWHHQHHLIQIDGGVLMRDIVTYRPPLGFLGSIANRLLIRRQLEGIFNYRTRRMEELFSKY